MQAKKLQCGIYARVSTDKQGDSVENQVGQGTEFISRLGDEYELNENFIFIDNAVSGYYTSVFDREAMKRAISFARDRKLHVLVFKEVSRVGRDKQENPAIIGMFEQFGVRVIAINDNYDSLNKDNITFDILSVLSEQESKKTSVRVSSAKKAKARRGQWNTDAPIGYKLNSETKRLEVEPEREGIVRKIFQLYTEEGLGTFLIGKSLNDAGIRSNDGNLFSRSTINNILTNTVYLGHTTYGKKRNELRREYDESGKMTKKKVTVKIDPSEWIVVENTHPAIIKEETFYKAQSILQKKSHNREPRRAYHPLTGILFCKKCGEGMVCQKRTFRGAGGDIAYRYYICKTYHKYGRDACSQGNVNAAKLEPVIVDLVKKRLREFLASSNVEAFGNRSSDIDRLEQEKGTQVKLLERANKDQMDLFNQRDLFPEPMYKQQMVELKKRAETIGNDIAVIDNQIRAIQVVSTEKANIAAIVEDFLNIDFDDLGRLRTLLQELVQRIDLEGDHFDLEYRYAFLVNNG